MALERRLVRLEEASGALGVSHWTLRLWAKQGRLKTVRVGKLRMVPISEVDRIAQHGISKSRKGSEAGELGND